MLRPPGPFLATLSIIAVVYGHICKRRGLLCVVLARNDWFSEPINLHIAVFDTVYVRIVCTAGVLLEKGVATVLRLACSIPLNMGEMTIKYKDIISSCSSGYKRYPELCALTIHICYAEG